MSRPNVIFIVAFAVYAVAMRILPHALQMEPTDAVYPWNFSPMTACCLFGAAYLARKSWAVLLPIAILFAGDLGIWLFRGDINQAFHSTTLVVYGTYVLIACLGMRLRKKQTLPAVWLTGLAGEICFFLITNLAVWAVFNTYPHTFAGLLGCYEMAIPYFKRSLASTLFFSTVVFSPFLYQQWRSASVVTESQPTAS